MDDKGKQGGFTLAELLVTLTVMSSLLALGVTTVGEIIPGVQLGAVSNDVLEHLYLARSEAIKRNSRVALCKSADGESCTTQGGWEQGWILFHDRNNSGTREPQEPILQRINALPAQYRLSANTPLARYVSYGPMGETLLVSHAFQAGTFTLCRRSVGSVEGRQIIVNAGGRPRVQKVQLADCM